MPNQEWHGLSHVYAHLNGCQMVGQYCQAYGLVHLKDVLVDGLDESLVQILDGFQLQFQVAIMSGFVAGFNVYKHKVVVLQRLDSCLRLALVIGIGQTGSTFHFHNLQASVVTNAANQIHSRNHRTRFNLWVLLHQRFHRRTITTAPRPDAVSLSLALSGLSLIIRVLRQQLLRFQNQLVQQFGCLLCLGYISLYQQWAPLFVRMIMGWGASNMLVAALDYQQVAILYARNKLYALAALTLVYGLGQGFVQIVNQQAGIFCFQITTVMRNNLTVLQVDNVTAKCQIVVGHLVAYRGCLQWSATLVHLIQVVTQNRCVSHLATWRKSLGHRNQSPAASLLSQLVHHRLRRIL